MTHVNAGTGEVVDVVGNPLARKISAIMGRVAAVAKNGKHGQGYSYAKAEDLFEIARVEMASEGLAMIPRALPETLVVTPGLGHKHDQILTTLMVEFTVIDGESGLREIGCYPGSGSDPLDKGAYKAMTGAEKYFLSKLFLIPVDKADDPERTRTDDDRGGSRELGAPPRTASTPQAARPIMITAPARSASAHIAQADAAAAPAAGPRPLAAVPARPAAPAVNQPRPLGSSPVAAPRPLAAVPAPTSGPRPLPPALEAVARVMDGLAADPESVGLTDVHERQRGTHPGRGEIVLWTVLTDTGQRLGAVDQVAQKSMVGSELHAAWKAGQRVVLDVQEAANGQGPYVKAIVRVLPAPMTAGDVKW